MKPHWLLDDRPLDTAAQTWKKGWCISCKKVFVFYSAGEYEVASVWGIGKNTVQPRAKVNTDIDWSDAVGETRKRGWKGLQSCVQSLALTGIHIMVFSSDGQKSFLFPTLAYYCPSYGHLLIKALSKAAELHFIKLLCQQPFFAKLSLFLTLMLINTTPNITRYITKQHAMLKNWINTKVLTASPCLFIWNRFFNLLLRFPEI